MKKEVIAYVHSHWDREWYREFEIFRMRLLRVFDNILDMLQHNMLPSFFFDGQVCALLDYLEIRPEKEEIVKELIRQKKLFIGPFYVLADEFLTNRDSFKKNLETGIKISKQFGCDDFVGYFADTFGHSACTIPILKEFGIDKAVVWRGCGDIPSEFEWRYKNSKINTVNLIRGYFNDIFATNLGIDKKAEFLKNNLDKIAEKSGNVLLMPIGADHLGVPYDLVEQIEQTNNLLEDYEIKIGTIFDYFDKVKNNFNKYNFDGELLNNSKTFILEGSFSSRLDLKKYNILAQHNIETADKLQKYFGGKYENLIDYAYRFLLKNQAHDSIYGCSTDDVHREDMTRYRKIMQITNNIIEEIRFAQGYDNKKIINLSDREYSGLITFKSAKKYPYEIIRTERGFDTNLLTDILRIPVTEDYTDIYTYIARVENIKKGVSDFKPDMEESDLFISDKCIGNSKIFLSVQDEKILIGDKEFKLIDFIDNGDSYNFGPDENDKGKLGKILSSKIHLNGKIYSILEIKIELDDILTIEVGLGKKSSHLDFKIKWENTKKNHLLQCSIDTNGKITNTLSEDLGEIIERKFDSDYDVRKHLPKEKGIEVKTNNVPMQRGVWSNNVGVVTKGITQYEVVETELRLPILRATGVISNPKNPARTTPAGPPIKTNDLQQLGYNEVEFSVFLGQSDELKPIIDEIFNYCLVM